MDTINPAQVSEVLKVAQAINSPAAWVILITALALWALGILIKMGIISTKQDRLLGQIARDTHDTLELMKRQVDFKETVNTLKDLAWGRAMNFRHMVLAELMSIHAGKDVHTASAEELREMVRQVFATAVNYVENLLSQVPASESQLTSAQKMQFLETYFDSIVKILQNTELSEKEAAKRLRSLLDISVRNSVF